MSKKIAVLGATGMTGRRIVEEALAQGYSVCALARDPNKLTVTHASLEIIQGDVANTGAIHKLVEGCNAVISAAGPANKAVAKAMVCSTAAKNVIAAMKAAGVKRYIVISGASVKMPSDRRDFSGKMIAILGSLMLGDVVKDKQQEYELLNESNLDWTLVRCPAIKDEDDNGEVKINIQTVAGMTVFTKPLARFLIGQITDTSYVKKGLFVASAE